MGSEKAALMAVFRGTPRVGPGSVVAGTVRVTAGGTGTLIGVALPSPPRMGSRLPVPPPLQPAPIAQSSMVADKAIVLEKVPSLFTCSPLWVV